MATSRVMGTCFATGHATGVADAIQGAIGNVNVNAVCNESAQQKALI